MLLLRTMQRFQVRMGIHTVLLQIREAQKIAPNEEPWIYAIMSKPQKDRHKSKRHRPLFSQRTGGDRIMVLLRFHSK